MDTQPSAPVQHPLRPYSVAATAPLDDFSWSRPSPSSTPPSLRYPAPPAPNASPNAPSTAATVLSSLVTASLLSFTGVALVQPFEVGKTLAQVQWVPKAGVLELLDPADSHGDDGDDDVVRDETQAEQYFADLSSVAQPGFAPPTQQQQHLAPPRPTDPAGYLSARDHLARPEWVMPIVVQGGVWDMIKSVARWKGEGWRSLWKGQLTTFLYDAVSTALQPAFLSLLTVLLSPLSTPSFTTLPLIYSPRPVPLLLFTTLSHALTTFVLSPLDLVRTRLIVQSSQPAHRKYSNPVAALATIAREEGGYAQTYLHANLVVPTVLDAVVRPLVHLSIPLVITRYLHVEPSTSPVSFALAELVLSSAGLLVTVPIETVRKRLQLQSRAEFVRAGRAGGVGRPWRSSVELRPTPYQGVVECVWRILTEETGRLAPPRTRRMSRRRRSSAVPPPPQPESGPAARPPPPRMNRTDSSTSQVIIEEEEADDDDAAAALGSVGLGGGGPAGGLRQLYRGLSMGIGANVVVFLLGILAGGGGAGGGGSSWAEM
ncbi:hypothetical protein JCM11491_000701 [Sporobolomyces phaffii]